ncbi:MAG: ATP-binding protein [Candidatus Micrarchaeota archaeon]|nr:ATP-binding protein [Candidatus Micrarchaeota archaeon]
MADEIEHKDKQTTILDLADSDEKIFENVNVKNNEIEKKTNIRNVHIVNDSLYTLFKNLNYPAVIIDDKKNILFVNERFIQEFKINEEEIKGNKISKILKNNHLFSNGKKINVETKEINLGLTTLVEFIDVSKEKMNEMVLRKLKALENIDMCIIEIKRNGKVVSCNEFSRKIIPEIKEDVNIKDYVKINKFNQKIKECVENNARVETDGIIYNGSLLVSVKIVPNGENLILIFNNKSQEVKLAEEIRVVREQYEQIVNNTTDIICIIDKNGKFKFVNKQFEKQLGYKEPYPTIFQIIHPEDMPVFVRSLTECEKVRKGFQDKEFRIYNNKRKMIYFAVSALPLTHENSSIEYSMTLRNITEKKKSEDKTVEEREKLKEDYKRLSEINRMKTEFVSMVSHDLKTPLTNIQGYASLLRNKVLGPNTPKQQEAAEIIDKESKRLAKLINDLLDLSKLDAGAITLHKRPFKLKDLEDKCSLRNMAESKGLTLIWNTPDSLGEVYGDPERIAQVLMNLVNNAIKFTDKGSVTINAFEKDRNNIQVDVIDTGPGIPKKEQQAIFERFQRSSISKLYKKEGSGLGLAIAKEIMKLHDSDIIVNSEVGKGSVFSIVLPKAKRFENKDNVDKYIQNIGVEQKISEDSNKNQQ